MLWLPTILILPYFILILKIYRNLLKIKPFNVTANPSSFVSVIVACRNEEKYLPALLDNISCQYYSQDLFEVIIVNDRSSDKTVETAAGYTGIRNLLILDNKGKGKKQALRTGILAARGGLVITTDADCTVGMNWIKTIAAFYEENGPDMMICPVLIRSTPGFFGRFQELEFMSLQGITTGTARSKNATMCNGANLVFTHEAYLHHSDNLHDEINSGDDVFFLFSLKKENKSKILWLESPDAQVTTASSSTYGSFLRQRSRWISKINAYEDGYTIVLGIITFVANILQIAFLIGCLINPDLFTVFLTIFILKAVPDFLILLNTTGRYGKRGLMWWFLPSQIVYPFYVLSVMIFFKINSPFPKET